MTSAREVLAELVAWANGCAAAYHYDASGSPTHAHARAGIWDDDNGILAGAICEECAMWDRARRVLAERDPIALTIVDAQISFCQQEDIAGTQLIREAVEFGYRAAMQTADV